MDSLLSVCEYKDLSPQFEILLTTYTTFYSCMLGTQALCSCNFLVSNQFIINKTYDNLFTLNIYSNIKKKKKFKNPISFY